MQHAEAETQIHKEAVECRYRGVVEKPVIISGLGAISNKNSGGVRIIHDGSKPVGGVANSSLSNLKCEVSLQRKTWHHG